MGYFGWLAQPAVFPWFALVVGLCIGSFLNVVIHRLPKMMEREWRDECAELARADGAAPAGIQPPQEAPFNLMVPRSRCPSCGRAIGALENIPLASYAVLRGRCAGCRAPIGLKYPLVELLAGVGGFYCAYRFGFGVQAIAAAIFVWATIALAFIDQETGLLPDVITLPLIWVGLLANAAGGFSPLRDAVVGAAAAYAFLWTINAVFRLLRGMDGMGYGDFKLFAATGAFFGWQMLLLVLVLSSVSGLFFGLLQMFAAKSGWDWKFKFHFGPYIAFGGIVAMFWGPAILRWYAPQL